MKKKKDRAYEEEEGIRELKPWMLNDIAPEIRNAAKDCARKHGVKVGEWVTHAIIQTHKIESGQTMDVDTFSELMDDLPRITFMRNSFISLGGKVDAVLEKLNKPWWKFWS